MLARPSPIVPLLTPVLENGGGKDNKETSDLSSRGVKLANLFIPLCYLSLLIVGWVASLVMQEEASAGMSFLTGWINTAMFAGSL